MQVRARRLREHEVVRDTRWYEAWLERTLLLDPIILDMWGPGVLSWAPGEPTTQDTLVKTQSLFGICFVGSVLSQVGRWPRLRPAA